MFLMPIPPVFLKVTSLSLVGTTSGTGGTVTVHASVQAGDIIMVGHGDRHSSPSVGTGFTEIDKAGNTNGGFTDSGICTAFKIADGTETTVSGWTGTGASWGSAVFRPNIPATSGAALDTYAYAGTGNPTANTISCTTATNPTIAIYAIWEASNVMGNDFGTFSADGNDPITGATQVLSDNGGHGLIVYFKEQAVSGAFDILADIGDIGVQASANGYVEVS
ncbi:hypothetical protein [Lentibacter algarum]|uniref:hypothetical protein n=1 Tax=Lentibacter algarum TaxID=576131 RepID=UPI0026F2FFCA|nr:hypothetical protein [Lentibacter algarum]